MSRETSLAKNTLIMIFGTVLPKLSMFITLPIITGCLTKPEWANYDIITTLVSLFLPVATLQIQTAAFRYLLDCKDDEKGMKRVITNVLLFVLCSSTVSLLILFFFLYKMTILLRILICLYFFTDILLLTSLQIVRGLSQPKLYSLCVSVQPVVNMILVVVLVYYRDGGLEGALIAMLAATALALCLVVIKGKLLSRIDIRLFSAGQIKELIAYSWPMIPNSLSLWFLNFSDRYVLKIFIGPDATADYASANKVPSMYSLANSAFTLAWQENASVNSKDDDASYYYGKMFDDILRILSGIMALLIAATPVLFLLLIRGDYQSAYRQMPFLLMAMFFSSMSSFLGGIYVAHKKTRNVGGTTMIAAVINLAIDLILVGRIGIYAASLSTLAAYMFLSIYRMFNVQRFQKIAYNYVHIVTFIVVLVIMCVLSWINVWYFNILNVVIGTVFAVIVNRNLIKKVLTMIVKRLR